MNISISKTMVSQQSTRLSLLLNESEIGHAWLNVTLEDGEGGEDFKYVGVIGDVFIVDGHRSKGLGTELLREAIEIAKEKKCKKLLALSRFENIKAHVFYERLGFVRHGFEFRMNF
ncbi:MAG: hypothetical protein QG653_474 [Patescibacteria group bacterium]|nr:hypothetical protein [Patescibacteria group bacterium]